MPKHSIEEVRRALQPWLEHHRRSAWMPLVEEGDAGLAASKLGGMPWLAEGEAWPTCGSCGEKMRLLLQLDLRTIPPEIREQVGNGLLQLFYCIENAEGKCVADAWAPFQPGKLVRIVKTPSLPVRRGADGPSFECKSIVGWESAADYPHPPEHDELGIEYHFDFNKREVKILCPSFGLTFDGVPESAPEEIATALAGEKLGGWPLWVQGVEYPDCPECGRRMRHVFQLDSERNVPFMFGDCGVGHITQCPDHLDVVAFGWACS